MPLQIQVIDGMVGNNPVFLSSSNGIPYQYESGAQASAIVQENQRLYADSIPPKRFRIVKVESEDDSTDDSWRLRESSRFQSGYYDPVPWYQESWFIESTQGADHFCHMSRDKSAMVAFTESPAKGQDDKQMRMRAGRYLTQFFGPTGLGVIDDIEIRYWTAKLSVAVGEITEVSFATSPDDIEEIYTSGPHSCMAYEADHYNTPCHPTRVYGAGDLAIAYLERESSIAARVLCYPEKQIYSTVYGDGGVWSDQLKTLLDEAGFHYSCHSEEWNGARLLRIEAGNGFVMPYFDIPDGATDCGDFLRTKARGEISTDNEDGASEGGTRNCDHCGDRYDDNEEGGTICDSEYCDSCYGELSFYCEDCDSTGYAEHSNHIEGIDRWVCDSCAAEYPTCDSCHESNSQESSVYVTALNKTFCDSCFEDQCFTCGACYEPDDNKTMVERIDGESICKSCAESMVECIECDKYDDSDSCYVDSDGDSWCSDCRQACLEFSEKESE